MTDWKCTWREYFSNLLLGNSSVLVGDARTNTITLWWTIHVHYPEDHGSVVFVMLDNLCYKRRQPSIKLPFNPCPPSVLPAAVAAHFIRSCTSTHQYLDNFNSLFVTARNSRFLVRFKRISPTPSPKPFFFHPKTLEIIPRNLIKGHPAEDAITAAASLVFITLTLSSLPSGSQWGRRDCFFVTNPLLRFLMRLVLCGLPLGFIHIPPYSIPLNQAIIWNSWAI